MITGLLQAIYSHRDRAGNCYWAFRYTDGETRREIVGTISGGRSNIYGILRHWGVPDDWDRSVLFSVVDMGHRDFMRLTKDWPYAGCRSEDLAAFIRCELQKEG